MGGMVQEKSKAVGRHRGQHPDPPTATHSAWKSCHGYRPCKGPESPPVAFLPDPFRMAGEAGGGRTSGLTITFHVCELRSHSGLALGFLNS